MAAKAGRIGRRGFVGRLLGLSGGLMVAPAVARAEPGDGLPPSLAPWSQEQGADVLSPAYGQPSPFEHGVVRKSREKPAFPTSASTLTPLQSLHGIVTPNGLHYERHHAGVPAIDPDRHRLMIHGLVERPMIFTLDDLMRFPSVSQLHFLECAGNTPQWKQIDPLWSVQDSHGLLSCAEWTGVRLADVLGEAGIVPSARWLLAEGADAALLTRSVPLARALDDGILAYAQNGERLRPEQGYPLRLLLPGFEGNVNIKWLRRLKLVEGPLESREETSKYTDLLPGGIARQFAFTMEVKSVITAPSGGQQLRMPGFYEISGLAWTGRGRIRRVEVSVDGGTNWQEARLQEPILSKCLTRFRLAWRWDGAPVRLLSRATDETGAVQPTREDLIARRGTNGRYHYNAVQSWQVAADGAVTNAG
jgi:sulfane dehydrogenase subunit SoxC